MAEAAEERGGTVRNPGDRYGRLVLVKRTGKRWGTQQWLCRCDCGVEKVVPTMRLRAGLTRSCGCLQRERIAEWRAAPAFPDVRAAYRAAAKRRGIPWTLANAEASALFRSDCHYCGSPPQVRGKRRSKAPWNGIDRVDSTKGYEPGNVVACCFQCNRAKFDYPVANFLEWAHRVAARHPRADVASD